MKRVEITTSKLPGPLRAVLRAGRVPLLVGPPGIGKSEILRAVAREEGFVCAVRDCAALDLTDLMGIPVPKGTEILRTVPPFIEGLDFETGAPVMFVLDELGKTPRAVRAGLLEFVREGRIGSFRIRREDRIVGATNRLEDAADEGLMSTALVNRLVVFNLRPDVEAWALWMASERPGEAARDVVRFVLQNPHLLHDLEAVVERGESNFPSPRSWTNLADCLAAVEGSADEETVAILAAGCVGETAGRAFAGWWGSRRILPPPSEVLAGKAKPVELSQPDAVALITACLQLVKQEAEGVPFAELDAKLGPKMENFAKYLVDCGVDRMGRSFAAMLAIRRLQIPISGTSMETGEPDVAPTWAQIVDEYFAPVIERPRGR